MPTVAELERLDGLVRRLTPMADVQRGALIRAGDWNALVSALLEVLRAVLADDATATAPAPHEHIDQVNLGWLDPRVRALVERGPLSEPTAVGRFDGMDRRLAQATQRMQLLEDTTRDARATASELAVRDERRASDLAGIRRQVDVLPDTREDILSLRESLNGIGTDVRRAIQVGDGLRVDGQPFDAQALADRLKGIEDLRQRWTAPDGTVFDSNALERRLTELSNTFISQAVLDQALDARVLELPPAQFDALQDRLSNTLSTRFEAGLDQTATDVRAELSAGLGRIDAIVGQRVAEAVPGLSDTVLATARGEFNAQLASTRAELVASITAQVAESRGAVLSIVDDRLAGVADHVATTLMAQVDGRIAAAVDPLRPAIDRIDERGRLNDAAITALTGSQTQAATRVEVVARTDEQARRALQTALVAQIDARISQQAASVDQRLALVDAQIQGKLDVAIRDATNSLSVRVDQIAGDAARREAQVVATQVRGEAREIAREEANVTAQGLRNEFRVEADRSLERVSGLVASEVLRQTASVPELVRNEVNVSRGAGGSVVLRPIDIGPVGPG